MASWERTISRINGPQALAPAPSSAQPAGARAVIPPAAEDRGLHSPFVMYDPADVIELLPAAAAVKLTSIRENVAAAKASAREISERQNEQIRLKFEAERAIGQLVHNHGLRADSDHPSVLEQHDRILRAVVELERIAPFLSTRVAVVNSVGGLLQGIERWLAEIPYGVEITAFNGPPPKLKSAPPQTVERCRSEIVSLRAEYQRVSMAQLPTTEAKKLARDRVTALVARGRPDLAGLFAKSAWDGSQEIQWAITSVEASRLAHGANFDAVVPDAIATMAWLFPDQMCARLEKEIDARNDDGRSMTDQAREARLSQLAAEILQNERGEEAAICAAETEGHAILRRADASPIAVLGLASNLPALEVL